MTTPYRIPDRSGVSNTSSTISFCEIHKDFLILLAFLISIVMCFAGLGIISKTDQQNRLSRTRHAVTMWANEHHGSVMDCKRTAKHYYCRVSTSVGNVRLVFDEVGDNHPFMILQDIP